MEIDFARPALSTFIFRVRIPETGRTQTRSDRHPGWVKKAR